METHITQHFKNNDQTIYKLITDDRISPIKELTPASSNQYFINLVREIIYQQLHSNAGNAIFTRVKKLFSDEKTTPNHIERTTTEELRNCGVSSAKSQYIKNIADAVLAGSLPFENFHSMKDDEIKNALTTIKGIWPRTADMFLMFSMWRENIFSHQDLWLKNEILIRHTEV